MHISALLLLLLPPLVQPFWYGFRGEGDNACTSQTEGPSDLTQAESIVLPNLTAALSPLVSTANIVYVLHGGDTLSSYSGSTLALQGSTGVPLAASSPYGLHVLLSTDLWVNGLGLLDQSLAVKVPSALQALVVLPDSAQGPPGIVATFEACPGAASQQHCFMVRLLGALGGAPQCTSQPVPTFDTVLTSSRFADDAAFLTLAASSSLGAGSTLARLDLSTCAVQLAAAGPSCGSGSTRTIITPSFSSVLVDICTPASGSGSGSGNTSVTVLSAQAAGFPALFAVTPSVPGLAQLWPGPVTSAAYSQQTRLLLSCALSPTGSSSSTPLQPYLLAFDISGKAPQQLWSTPLPSGQRAALTGMALDAGKGGQSSRLYGAAGGWGVQGLYGGLLVYSADTGELLLASECCGGSSSSSSACQLCGLYSQPAIGRDGSLYTFVSSSGQWEGLVAFQAPPPPALSPQAQGSLLRVLAIVGGVAGGVLLLAAALQARRVCAGAGGSSAAEGGQWGPWQEEEEEEEGEGEEGGGYSELGQGGSKGLSEVQGIKAELRGLGVDYSQCVEKSELQELLRASRQRPAAAAPGPRFMT